MPTRYRAEWVESYGNQTGPGFDPDKVVYRSRLWNKRALARDWARKHDIEGEGKVYTEEHEMIDGIPNWHVTEVDYPTIGDEWETEQR